MLLNAVDFVVVVVVIVVNVVVVVLLVVTDQLRSINVNLTI